MLISLSSLGDLSRFVRPRDRPQLHETVLLLVDGTAISCSGTILAARSALLEKEVAKHYEIALDSGFNGTKAGVVQCLELLYGGEIFLDFSNIIPIMRFGVQFEIKEMVMRCTMWLEENNLYPKNGLFKDPCIEEKLKQVDKLAPRVRKMSTGSRSSSTDSRSLSRSASCETDISDESSESERSWSRGLVTAAPRETLPKPAIETERSWSRGLVKAPRVVPARSIIEAVLKGNKLRGFEDLDEGEEPWMTARRKCSSSDNGTRPESTTRPKSGNGTRKSSNCSTTGSGYIVHSDTARAELVASVISAEEFPPSTQNKLSCWGTGEMEQKTAASISINPTTQYAINIDDWENFTVNQVRELCNARCLNPEYVQIEVAIGWLVLNGDTLTRSQRFVDQLLQHIDPLRLSKKYVLAIKEYINHAIGFLSLPPHFNLGSPGLWNDSDFKFKSYEWMLNERCCDNIRSRSYTSILTTCHTCPNIRAKQEIVFKLAPQTPCYDLFTSNCRIRVAPEKAEMAPSHYHPGSVVHWIMRVGEAGRLVKIVSLVTADYKTARDVVVAARLNTRAEIDVMCLQE